MKYRKYLAADRGDCLAIFDSNARHHFAPTDRQKYERFLANPPGFYGVLCGPANQVVACGGVRVAAEGTKAVLTWGMVHAELQDEAISRACAGPSAKVGRLSSHRYRRETDAPRNGGVLPEARLQPQNEP